MQRVVAYATVLLLFLAACGGGETADSPADDASAAAETSVAPAVNETSASTETVPPPPSEDTEGALETAQEANQAANTGAAGGTASVTFDGMTVEVMSFEDALVQRCDPNFFGGFWVILLSDPDPASQPDSVEMAFPGGDYTDPPRLRIITDAGESEWLADESDVPEGAPTPNIQWTVEGNTVTGSATLYEENSYFAFNAGQTAELRTAEATFEATCPSS